MIKVNRLVLLAILAYSTLSADYQRDVKLPSITFPIAVDKDFRVMQRNCQWCHSYGYILNQGKQSKEFWNKVVVKMRDVYKAPITEADEITTTNYLYKHYGDGELK